MKENLPREKKVTVFLTEHAMDKIARRFDVDDPEQVEKVLGRAATEGYLSTDEGELLLEHGCLLATGIHNGNGCLTVKTALNLTPGISGRMKKRTRNARPTPWSRSEVVMMGEPEEGQA